MTRAEEQRGVSAGNGKGGRKAMAVSLLRVGAAGGAALAVVAVISTLATSTPALRVPLAMVPTGLAVLRILVAAGVWRLARWALWTGAVLAVLSLALLPLLEVARVQLEGGVVEVTPISHLLLWGQISASVALLVGLASLPRVRRTR